MIKSKLRRILEENWDEFYKKYKNRIRPSVIAEVKKVMKCKDISNGYIELKCADCGEIKKVGFTCKSRFCTSCGKVYVDNWVNGMLGKLIDEMDQSNIDEPPCFSCEKCGEYIER